MHTHVILSMHTVTLIGDLDNHYVGLVLSFYKTNKALDFLSLDNDHMGTLCLMFAGVQ